ncbi:MAG: hypothetical protein PSN35_07485, partial [Candidatus Thioglobus sp.]|uniref:hypothetical protein n=1 Tax=Candidatus Thioglobus sp. TaxID=2026721 RepID=UPI0026057BA3
QNYISKVFDSFILVFNAIFSYSMVTSFSGGRSQSIRRERPTIGKKLVNFITCGCESSAKPGMNPCRIAVGNLTT